MSNKGTIYLIPSTLGETSLEKVLPLYNTEIIKEIRYFVVEELKTARRFLKSCDKTIDIDELTFYELNEHSDIQNIEHLIIPATQGMNIGLISEAGCPAVADPGSELVALAHKKGIRVVPLVGPSSILLALMASGMNGQNFSFVGYLPMKDERRKTIKNLESISKQKNQTQIFIETPYRNQQMFDDIIQTCNPETLLCVASNITASDEYIVTKPVKEWKHIKVPLHKVPAIFLLYCK